MLNELKEHMKNKNYELINKDESFLTFENSITKEYGFVMQLVFNQKGTIAIPQTIRFGFDDKSGAIGFDDLDFIKTAMEIIRGE